MYIVELMQKVSMTKCIFWAMDTKLFPNVQKVMRLLKI